MGFLGSRGLRLNKIDIYGRLNSRTPLTLLHGSDLHGVSFGKDQRELAVMLEGLSPDLLFLTGDLIDERTSSMDNAQRFIELLPAAKGFFVPGNHDPRSSFYPDLERCLENKGIRIMVNQDTIIEAGGVIVRVVGLDDLYHGRPDFSLLRNVEGTDGTQLRTIVAAHSPTVGRKNLDAAGGKASLLEMAREQGADLVLCGHTHGGQVNLPLVGALYAPGQGLFPKIVGGVYSEGTTSMYVTQGLGTSHIPVRLFCPPEITLIRWYP